ncbi:hypothetical protein Esti_006665 [Eimeria stiedai]
MSCCRPMRVALLPLLLLLLLLLLLGASVKGKTLGRGVWVSSGQFGIGEAKGPQSVSLGAAIPLQLPFKVSAFARLSTEVPLHLDFTQQLQQEQQQHVKEALQQQQQEQDTVKAEGSDVRKLGLHLQQRLQHALRGQLQLLQQQLQQLQQSGLKSEVVVGLSAADMLGNGGTFRLLSALGNDKPKILLSGMLLLLLLLLLAPVTATLRGLRVLGLSSQRSLQFNKATVAIEGACDFEKSEAGFRVAAAGFTAAAGQKRRGLLRPSLLGAQLKVRGPLNALMVFRPRAAAATATGDTGGSEETALETGGFEAESMTREEAVGDDPEASFGLSFAFGDKAETLVEPKLHLPSRRVSLEVSRQLGLAGMVSLGLSPSGVLRMQWADAAADGGLWVVCAELPLQRCMSLSSSSSSSSRGPAFTQAVGGGFPS